MQASKKLVEAFRNVAIEIRDGNEFDWGYNQQCNCGLLARELGVSLLDFQHSCMIGHWKEIVDDIKNRPFCKATDRKMDKVFDIFIDNGITLEDIPFIENCGLNISHDLDMEIAFMHDLDLIKEKDKIREKLSEFVSSWFFDQANLMEAKLNSEKKPEKVRLVII